MLRITKDLEIDDFRCIAVKGIVHCLLGQVGHSMAQPTQKLCHHAAITRSRNFCHVMRTQSACKGRLRTPYRVSGCIGALNFVTRSILVVAVTDQACRVALRQGGVLHRSGLCIAHSNSQERASHFGGGSCSMIPHIRILCGSTSARIILSVAEFS